MEPRAPERPPKIRFLDARGPSAPLDPFRPLEPTVDLVTFGSDLDEADLARAGRLFAERPDVRLRVHKARSPDLRFLRHFPGLRHLSVAIYELDSVDGLSAIRDSLQSFNFERTRRSFNPDFLLDLPELEALDLEGHDKAIGILGRLTQLSALGLRSVKMPDLAPLLAFTSLRRLSLVLGGARDLGLAPRFSRLETLHLMRVTGLADLSMLAEVETLETLSLDWLRNVVSLPSLAPLRRLRSVSLETMKGLTSLAPVAAAPALRQLEIINMPQLAAADFAPLLAHPSLQVLRAFPGSN